jgi:predicted PurR-regulated permease PerM
MYPLAWAAVIAIATWPAYIRFRALIFPRPSQLMAPLLFTVLVGAVLVVPVILTVHQVAQGSDAFVQWIGELRRNGIPIPSWVTRLPIASEYLVAWWRANLGDPQAALAGLRHVNLESLTAWTSALSGWPFSS